MARKASKSAAKKVTLVESDEKRPLLALKHGMKLDVVTVRLVDGALGRSRRFGARLCGGSSTCLALINVGTEGDDV